MRPGTTMMRGDEVHCEVEYSALNRPLMPVDKFVERPKLVAIVATYTPHRPAGFSQGLLIGLAANRALPDVTLFAAIVPSCGKLDSFSFLLRKRQPLGDIVRLLLDQGDVFRKRLPLRAQVRAFWLRNKADKL